LLVAFFDTITHFDMHEVYTFNYLLVQTIELIFYGSYFFITGYSLQRTTEIVNKYKTKFENDRDTAAELGLGMQIKEFRLFYLSMVLLLLPTMSETFSFILSYAFHNEEDDVLYRLKTPMIASLIQILGTLIFISLTSPQFLN